MKIEEFLEKKGYKEFMNWKNDHIDYAHLGNYRSFQKKVNSKNVCDTNDALYINIERIEYHVVDHNRLSYSVEIRAEKNDKWYTLNSYGLDEKTLYNDIDLIEKQLIASFNAISNAKFLNHD